MRNVGIFKFFKKSFRKCRKSFRNFKNFKTSFNNKLNILFGDNGCGKTNILEGISLIAKGKGLRNSNILNLIKKQEENFLIKNNLEIQKNQLVMTCRLSKYWRI